MPRERFKDDIFIDLTGTQSKHALAAHPIQRFDDDIFVRVIKLVQMGHLAADQSRCCKLGKLKNREFFWVITYRTALIERSEEHTSELQSRGHLVCRLLLEKKN